MGKQTTTCNRTHSVASRRRRNELDNVINKHEFPVGITSENRGNKEVSKKIEDETSRCPLRVDVHECCDQNRVS